MEDLITKYKKKNKKKIINILATSFVFALAINFWILNWGLGTMKWSVIDSNWSKVITNAVNTADLFMTNNAYWENHQSRIITKNAMKNVESIIFSIKYWDDILEILDTNTSLLNAKIITLADTNWQKTITIKFSVPTNIDASEEIFSIISRKKENKPAQINLYFAWFEFFDWETMITKEVTTSWIDL